MDLRYLMMLAILVFLAGCDTQTGVSPVETVIEHSSERDFGFVGTWVPLPNAEVPHDTSAFEMEIKRDGSYTATLSNTIQDAAGQDISHDELTVDFRTYEISQDQPHAIVEIELKAGDRIRYHRLAIAAVDEDYLYLWMIDGRKIGKHLYQDGVAAMIEHHSFSTSIRCDSEKLLESLAKHCGEITGTVQTFKRQPEVEEEDDK